MALYPNSEAYRQSVPFASSEVQRETLPELNVLANESQATWETRTRTITFTEDDGSLLGIRYTTAPLAFDATTAEIQTALEGLAGIGAGNIKVTGDGRTFTYAFDGDLVNKSFKRMYHTRENGIKSYFDVVQMGVSESFQTALRDQITREAVGATQIEPTFEKKTPTDLGQSARYASRNQILTEMFTSLNNGVAAGGTRTLSFGGQTTTAIAWNATPATIQAALVALSNVAPGDITVSKVNNQYLYTFGGALKGVQPQIIGDYSLLTGLRGSITVSQQGSANREIVEQV